MNYEEMSDFEINKLVAKETNENIDTEQYEDYGYGDRDENVVIITRYNKSTCVDYCNNPSDAWSIILENKISVHPTATVYRGSGGYIYNEGWEACSANVQSDVSYNSPFFSSKDKNPLRAAMVVFLMMNEEQK